MESINTVGHCPNGGSGGRGLPCVYAHRISGFYNGTEGRSLADRHDQQLAENLKLQFIRWGTQADRATLIRFTNEDSWLRVGR